MVVAEKLNGIGERFSWVLKSFIDQERKVCLLVSPVNFKQRLEPGKELLHLIECTFNDVTDNVFMIHVELILLNPREGVEMFLIMLFPGITNDIIPLFESISIWLQISMFAPSLEVLNAFKALIEAEYHTVRIIFSSRGHLKPVLLDVGHHRLILDLSWGRSGAALPRVLFLGLISLLGL